VTRYTEKILVVSKPAERAKAGSKASAAGVPRRPRGGSKGSRRFAAQRRPCIAGTVRFVGAVRVVKQAATAEEEARRRSRASPTPPSSPISRTTRIWAHGPVSPRLRLLRQRLPPILSSPGPYGPESFTLGLTIESLPALLLALPFHLAAAFGSLHAGPAALLRVLDTRIVGAHRLEWLLDACYRFCLAQLAANTVGSEALRSLS